MLFFNHIKQIEYCPVYGCSYINSFAIIDPESNKDDANKVERHYNWTKGRLEVAYQISSLPNVEFLVLNAIDYEGMINQIENCL